MGTTFNSSELQRGTSSSLHTAQEPLLDKKKELSNYEAASKLAKGKLLRLVQRLRRAGLRRVL